MVKFAIFSGETSATLDPWSISPTKMMNLGYEPLRPGCEYEEDAQTSKGRGSRIKTLGGSVDQAFANTEKDNTIRVSVKDAPVTTALITALEDAYEDRGGQFYFTNGVNCWKVKFDRQNGLKLFRNMQAKFYGQDRYSYEILLHVDSKEI